MMNDSLGSELIEELGNFPSEDTNSDNTKKRNKTPIKVKHARLPLGRIKQIIKMDPDVTNASADAVFLITKAAELFIESLSKDAYGSLATTKMKTILGRHVDSAISNSDALLFLEGAMDF